MTFDRLQQLYLGVVGGSPRDFWDMQPAEVINAIIGHSDHAEEMVMATYDSARMHAWLIYCLFSDKHKSPKHLFKFGWETDAELAAARKLTPEEIQAIFDRVPKTLAEAHKND